MWQEDLNTLIEQADKELSGKSVNGDNGEIISVVDISLTGSFVSTEPDVVCSVSVDHVVKKYYMSMAIFRKVFTVDDEVLSIINKYIELAKPLQEEKNKADEEVRLEKDRLKKEALEKKKAEENEKIRLAKISANRRKAEILFESCKEGQKCSDSLFYYSIGWLASHANSVNANVPDWAEEQFVKTFGTEAKKRVVDTAGKTSGGFDKQWACDGNIRLKSVAGIPAELAKSVNDNKVFYNTAFVYMLVANYGFTFGKEQNLENIKKCIPEAFMNDFDAGYNS